MTTTQVWMSEAGHEIRVGTLYSHRRGNAESATFEYSNEYLAWDDAYDLDPTLQRFRGSFQTPASKKIFNAFSDSSPDRWGRGVMNRHERKRADETGSTPRSLGEIDFLLGARDDLRQGSLRFRLADDEPFLSADPDGVPVLATLGDVLSLADRSMAEEATADELRRLVAAGGSLGGMRPKAHVLKPDGSIAIAKFPAPSIDEWDVMAWEEVTLGLARDAGIEVPSSQLIQVSGRTVLLVDRFDRTPGGDRIGYCSALTMLEASDGDTRSYVEIAEVIEETSLSATAELHQLWRRMAFSALISNTDDHLRNHAFLRQQRGWRLSPAFDMNPNPRDNHHRTTIREGDTVPSVDALFEVAPYFRLSEAGAVEILATVHRAVGGWRRKAYAVGLSKGSIYTMEPAFEHERKGDVVELMGR